MCGSTCLGLPLLSWVFKSCFSCVVINKVQFAVIHVPRLPPKWEGSLIHNAAGQNNAIGSKTLPTLPCIYVHTYICTYIRTYVRTCVFYHSLIYSSYIALTSVCLVLPCTTSLSSTLPIHIRTYVATCHTACTYVHSYVPYSVYVCTHQSVLVSGASDSR